ncbi:MAG: SCO family protein [Thermoleophilaceae bacterium]
MLTLLVARSSDDAPGPVAERASGLRGDTLPVELRRGQAPRIRLRSAHGGIVDTRELRGRPYAVTFLYARCPDVCPLIGQEIRQSLELLGRRARQAVVLGVSADPAGDTAEAARSWLRRQRLPRNFRYLIGLRRELAPVWEGY